jgi:hypothetical protein
MNKIILNDIQVLDTNVCGVASLDQIILRLFTTMTNQGITPLVFS